MRAPDSVSRRPLPRSKGLLVTAVAAALVLSGCAGDGESTSDAGATDTSAAPSSSSSPSSASSSAPTTPEVTSSPEDSETKQASSATPSPSASTSAPKQSQKTSAAPKTPATRPAHDLEVLVNKRVPLQPADYAPADLVAIGNGQQLRSAAAGAYQQLVSAASAAGYQLSPSSAYRSYATQVETHNHWKNQYGAEYAEKISARPGHSEHQTGLAVDVMPASGQCRLEQCFGQLPEGKWVAANAHRYGFIIRYPQGQDSVTGYSYEPWHLRYVGVETATAIKNSGKTMEAYYGFPAAPNYR
ncbi:M15 family metallopeptidase [Micrococcoides hystricis]|uniref:D-alanyl-D-alanine carboxypeptidase family protein n=1 Tax=Micrococcoides hystricis TaxID=1572761 RepID=A0ABV6P9W3_9MICC